MFSARESDALVVDVETMGKKRSRVEARRRAIAVTREHFAVDQYFKELKT